MLFRYLNDDEFREVYTHCGYVEGLEDGAKKNALETAAKLKVKGFPTEEICELTGLTPEEVAAL